MKIIMKDDAVFTKAHQEYRAFTRDDRIREVYEAREKALKDYNSGIKLAADQGKREGKREAARQMLEEKLSVDLISRVTGLTQKEIEGLAGSKP